MLKRLHRILGLTAVLFWLVQILTGAGIEALWLIDGAVYRGADEPADAKLLAQRVQEVKAAGASGVSLWAAGSVAGQMKIFYTDPAGGARVRRIGTHGEIIYDVSGTSLRNREGLAAGLSLAHETFLGGAWGRWLAAVSGALLVSNLIMGMRLALRGRINWRLFLFGGGTATRTARRFHLHRMGGLWMLIPGLALTMTGVLLGVSEALSVSPAAAQPVAAQSVDTIGPPTSLAQAIGSALAEPDDSLSALVLPTQADGPYELLVRTHLDNPRFWGTTRLRVSAHGDKVLYSHRGADTLSQRMSEAVYPFHTAQVGGVAGRVVALATAVGLLGVIGYGVALWQSRRTTFAGRMRGMTGVHER
jgi:uncharacterized iron-regulated membrane protein